MHCQMCFWLALVPCCPARPHSPSRCCGPSAAHFATWAILVEELSIDAHELGIWYIKRHGLAAVELSGIKQISTGRWDYLASSL